MNNKQKARTHLFVAFGETAARSRCVACISTTATTHNEILAIAGETATSADGTEATIIDGAGFAATWAGKPVALVGSRFGSGDRFTTAQHAFGITIHQGEQIPGLFNSAWIPLQKAAQEGGKHA